MPAYSIRQIKYAETTLGADLIFANRSDKQPIPIIFALYLIEGRGRKILVDAGCETMPGFVMIKFESPCSILERYGIPCSAITDVIITHSHHDHMELVSRFPNALIHIQRAELEEGRMYLGEDQKLNVFDNKTEVAPGVWAIKIGGHSAGSCIVRMDNLIITGDECYLRECLTRKIPTGSTIDRQASRAFVEHYSDPRYKILLSHDPEPVPGIPRIGFN